MLLSPSVHAADCSVTSTGLIPLYQTMFVPRTAEQQAAGLAAVTSIPAGTSVLLSIGMSNARGVWFRFIDRAAVDSLKSPDVKIVNGAVGGGSASNWAIEDESKTWGKLDGTLASAGVTKANVTVMWFMLANSINRRTVEDYSAALESDARNALDLFVVEFPNLKVIWLQSMIYAGYSTASGNYEPFAYESGKVAQRLVADQNWPFFVGYGPYLWADGLVPRDDGLTWLCSDFDDDGHHPSFDGDSKHADYLLQFFHEDSIASIGYLDAAGLLPVPDLAGLDQASAEAAIVAAGLVVGSVSTANSDTVAAGNVISQNPAAGASVAPGSTVDLVISLGPVQLTTVPDVAGIDQASAEAAIVAADLVVGTVSTANSDTVAAGNVISQNPAGGASVAQGAAVDLVISLGPVIFTTVPDVAGLDQASAEASIVAANLIVGTVSTANSDTVVAGNVISQNPAGGASVAQGSAVDLSVSLGPLPSTPSIISPANGSTLTGSSVTFVWSAQGESVTGWRLEVGTTPGGRDILRRTFSSSVTSQTVTGLPTDGRTIYVNLHWRTSSAASVASYVYTASTGGP